VKLPEFLQATYRKVVKLFLCPVLGFWIVEPFDEVKDSFAVTLAALGRGYDFLHIVFL